MSGVAAGEDSYGVHTKDPWSPLKLEASIHNMHKVCAINVYTGVCICVYIEYNYIVSKSEKCIGRYTMHMQGVHKLYVKCTQSVH